MTVFLQPQDTHNARLVDAVHPASWRNPTPTSRYHLVVIGAGTAGLVTAAGAAGLGARVALIERSLMGGDCLNVGCVPSKSIIAAARAWSNARLVSEQFHGARTVGDGDFAAVMERMRRQRADIAPVDGAERFKALGVDVFLGDAAFLSPDTIGVAGTTLRFRRAVIATGARAATPSIPGLRDVSFLTNETLFELTERPAHLIVLGSGPIGCEMAQAFARLGSAVTLIDRGMRILSREDAEASLLIQQSLQRDGVDIRFDTTVEDVTRTAQGIGLMLKRGGRGEHVVGTHLLVATGRTPNVERLGLEAAGVAFTATGVTVNDRLQTTNPRVFACGDVSSPLKFTHAADFQARIVIQNALFFGRKRVSQLVTPRVTYTSPEVAQVGHTAQTAKVAGIAVTTITVPLTEVDRAILDGETAGFTRIHLREGTDRIVGGTIVAEHAGDLLAEVTLCMTNDIGLSAIGATMHPYPTQGDALRKCADGWRKTKLTPTARSLFAQWFRWFN